MQIGYTPHYRQLLLNSVLAIFICSIIVFLCYQYVDRSVAFFVHQSGIDQIAIFRWITYLPSTIFILVPFIFITVATILAFRPLNKIEHIFFIIALNVASSETLKNILKFVFGRYWPNTWRGNNLSLINNHVYGFAWFHGSEKKSSFPSGHTTVTFAALIILWQVYPKWRWLYALVCLSVMISLIATNYHFVSDTIAGAFLGSICATYAFEISGLARRPH